MVYAFNTSIEDLARDCKNIEGPSPLFKHVLEAMNVLCNKGKVHGKRTDYCVEMVFVDFPSNLVVEGCLGHRVPPWNVVSESLYEATFQFVDFCLNDHGFITCLYTMEEGVKIEHEATSRGFVVFHRQVVKCTPPVGKKMGQLVTKVAAHFSSTKILMSMSISTYSLRNSM